MKTALAALLLLACPQLADSAEFSLSLERGKPSVSITVPDSWKPKLASHGLEATAPDGKSFIVAKVIKGDEASANAYDDETTGYLEEQGVLFPPAKPGVETKTIDTDTKINDLDAFVSRIDEATTFKGAATSVIYYAVPLSEAETLNIISRGPEDDAALAAIVASVKPIK